MHLSSICSCLLLEKRWEAYNPALNIGAYLAYISYILISSPIKTIHVQHVKKVLSKLLENQLYVNGEKCEFHIQNVAFLGYIIGLGLVLIPLNQK